MTTPVNFEIYENIAVISLNSPPVNGLGLKLREALLDSFRQAIEDSSVVAVVIASAGKLFCGGADIGEFGSDLAMAEPALPSLLDEIETSPKLVVAALNGAALGGGCELALACDYRIALPSTKIALPEVNLGIIPGAGGTQRLPRLGGPVLALDMITSGKPVGAKQLLEAGVIDHVYEGDGPFLEAAINYTRELYNNHEPVRSCADLQVDVSELADNFFENYRAGIAKRTRGFFAPERCIQAVEAACNMSLADGLKKEAELFDSCMETPQARAQQHIFFAERAAAKIPDIAPGTKGRDLKKVAVIGSGTMGGGIAMNFLNAGIDTVILDLSQEALDRGVGVIRKNYEISAKKGRLTEALVEERMGLLSTTTDYSDLAEVDLVIEAVFEDMAIKKKVFETLDRVCKPGAMLATNTSTLDVNEIASVTKRPADVIGLHFFSPANVMRLLEIVRGDASADDAMVTAIKMAQQIGKVPVVSRVGWGFIGNRVLEPYGREAARLVLEGASPAQIDRVLNEFGLAMGLPSMIDLAGIDVGYLTRQGNTEAFYGRDPSYAAICDRLYKLGRYGQKTGRGFYIYEGRDKQEDPEVMALAEKLAAEFGIERREITDQEILERTIYMLINEGAHVLEEGIASRAGDIDIAYCNGYGFPIHRGGPMQYANEIGLDAVLEAIERHQRNLGEYGALWFKPAPLLQTLVASGEDFKDFDARR